MQLGIEIVENKKSGSIFVYLEQKSGINISVINPDGNVIDVPSIIFNEKRSISSVEANSLLTTAQVKALNAKPKRQSKDGGKTTRTIAKRKKKTKGSKVGLGAEWTSSRLTFYKHKIEPLDLKQWFVIDVESVGKIKMTREEFNSEFMDVILKEDYWKHGSYAYLSFPEKAEKFILT